MSAETQKALGEGPVEVLGAAAARGDGPAEHPLQQGALGARLGAAADLLVVEGGEHRNVGGRLGGGGGGDQRGDARVHGDLVVQPGRDEELLVGAEIAGRLDVVQHQVPSEDIGDVGVRLGGDPGEQGAGPGGAEAPQRGHVQLRVERDTFVDAAVEVDGELGYAQQRLVDADEAAGSVAQGQSARDAEVAVEPGVVRDAAVDFHGDLPPARGAGVGLGLDPQVRGVGVGSDDPERGAGRGARGDVPGKQRSGADDVPATLGTGRPVVRLAQLLEARLLQALGRVRDHVVGRGAGADEGEQIVAVTAVMCGGHGRSRLSEGLERVEE